MNAMGSANRTHAMTKIWDQGNPFIWVLNDSLGLGIFDDYDVLGNVDVDG